MLFACIFVPDFPAEAVARAEPELRGQAIVVVDGTAPLLKVFAANERARLAGIEIGMTKLQAQARLAARAKASHTAVDQTSADRAGVDHGVIRRRSAAQESAAHDALADCARGFSPRVEQCTADTVLLDLRGLDRLFGPPQKIARELARRASELGLETHIAVAANLDAAICAARGFAGITILPAGKEAERLAPLPVEVLLQAVAAHPPTDVALPARQSAADLLETLDRWGIRTFRALAALPEIAVSERLGPAGVYLHKLCRGQGSRTLNPTDSPLHFEEVIELEYPIEDLEALAFVLNRLIDQLCARLSARTLSTNELRLRMELERCRELQISDCRLQAEPTFDNLEMTILKSEMYERTLRLPVPILDAKTFLRLFQLELRAVPPAGPVAKICLGAEPVQPRRAQGGLFLPATPEPERLELTLARIANVVRQKNASAKTPLPATESRPAHSREKSSFDPGSRFDRSTHTVIKPPLSTMVPLDQVAAAAQAMPRPGEDGSDTSRAITAERPADAASEPPAAARELRVGSAEIPDTHRPGAFRVKRFAPPDANSVVATDRKDDMPAANVSLNDVINSPEIRPNVSVAHPGTTALRVFRPPLEAHVECLDRRPTRLRTMTTSGISGPIAWCAGPWRSSGEWWQESWSRDEWDVAIETQTGRVLCRVFRNLENNAWFVEGTYD